MTTAAALGLAAFGFVTLCFLRFGNRRGSLVLALATALAGFSLALRTRDAGVDPASVALIVLGLVLYAFGLALVGYVLERSVTLKLLRTASQDDALEGARHALESRAGELTQRGLARREAGLLQLTRRGRAIAWLTEAGRRATGTTR